MAVPWSVWERFCPPLVITCDNRGYGLKKSGWHGQAGHEVEYINRGELHFHVGESECMRHAWMHVCMYDFGEALTTNSEIRTCKKGREI